MINEASPSTTSWHTWLRGIIKVRMFYHYRCCHSEISAGQRWKSAALMCFQTIIFLVAYNVFIRFYEQNVGTHVLFYAVISMFCPIYCQHCWFIIAYSHYKALMWLPNEKFWCYCVACCVSVQVVPRKLEYPEKVVLQFNLKGQFGILYKWTCRCFGLLVWLEIDFLNLQNWITTRNCLRLPK